VRNTVADAREGYEAVASALGTRDDVTLFHARFALSDRLRIEQQVVDRFGLAGSHKDRRGRIVVATQVVEQSLDIDFDFMVTDICPIDLVIQRAGRLQRHGGRHPGRPPPRLDILAPAWSENPPAGWLAGPFRRTARVYGDPAVLWRTARELHRRGKLPLPEDARALVEAVYDNTGELPDSLQARSDLALGHAMSKASVAQNAVLKLDVGYLREGVDWADEVRTPTRLGEPTVTVRLARVDESGAGPWCTDVEERLRWPLSQLTVACRLVSRPTPADETLRAELEATQPFVGDDVVTVILRRDGNSWTGQAIAEQLRGGEVTDVGVKVVYSEASGLDVHPGG
jgi:CRISPR-associated endonuclease/helicase Cas3